MAKLTETPTVSLLDLKKTGDYVEVEVPGVTVDPWTGEEYPEPRDVTVTYWMQRLQGDDAELVFRRANAEKAKVLIAARDPESDMYLAISALVDGWTTEMITDYLVTIHATEREDIIAARHAYEDGTEWASDGYLDSLRNAWLGVEGEPGLRDTYARDPENPEAKKVFDEMVRFDREVRELLDVECDRKRAELRQMTEEDLRRSLVEDLIGVEADRAYAKELHRCQVWVATRKANDHNQREFGNRADIERLDVKVRDQLIAGYRKVAVDPLEGKELPAALRSWGSSGSAGEEEDSTTSSLADASG